MSRLVIGAASEVGVVVEGVSADIGVVAVGEKFLHFPVVGPLADGEFEIFLSDGIPELMDVSEGDGTQAVEIVHTL